MEHYTLIKVLHWLPAVLLLLGLPAHTFMIWKARRNADPAVLARKLRVTRRYSLPAMGAVALSLPVSGWWLVHIAGWPLSQLWLLLGSALFALLILFGFLLHGRLGDWQALAGQAASPRLLRFTLAYAGVILALLLALFAVMGAKPV
ncbi:DUF2269 family protein [Pseudomonas sp. LRF_L74]|uniref:DUF2269 family protein n=1 Tax=Pseudomonas sp. LRF_L74 TaxID=3369422 RepID=UPI003F5FFAF1